MTIKVYTPGLNGSAFIGMCEIPGPGFAPLVHGGYGRFVRAEDYDALYAKVVRMRDQVGKLKQALNTAQRLMIGAMSQE